MDIQAFCEQVLFSARLEDKLWTPKVLTDGSRPVRYPLPRSPIREKALEVEQNKSKKLPFPKLCEMEHEETRGQVFHFFANHELLALELMALCLLRFPDAPPGFRKGVAETMKEEQAHLKLYLQRMQELGVEFGQFPLNDFFWHCLKDMASVRDYICGMSLTFEQANLDFASYYRDIFAKMGDHPSSKIMTQVYEEEIRHVAHGVRWFSFFWPEMRSMWRAYVEELRLPLTPVRARGLAFCEPARKRAGLDQEFIDELRVYADNHHRSKKVYVFNSDCELALSLGAGWQPSLKLQELMADYAPLMGFLASEGDGLLCSRKDPEFLKSLRDCGFPLPRYLIELEPGSQVEPFGHRGQTKDFGVEVSAARGLFDKRTFLPLRADPDLRGQLVSDRHAVLECLAHALQTGFRGLVLKCPFGAAGQGQWRLVKEPSEEEWAFIDRRMKVFGSLLAEPLLDRKVDLSILGDTRRSVEKLTLTQFFTDSRGRYLGHGLGPVKHWLKKDEIEALWRKRSEGSYIEQFYEQASLVYDYLTKRGYRGPFGVDGLLYQREGQYGIQPLVEVNPRYTMGHIGLKVSERVAFGVKAKMMPLTLKGLTELGIDSFKVLEDDLRQRFPILLSEKEGGRIREGVLWLTPPQSIQCQGMVLLVGERALNYGKKFVKE